MVIYVEGVNDFWGFYRVIINALHPWYYHPRQARYCLRELGCARDSRRTRGDERDAFLDCITSNVPGSGTDERQLREPLTLTNLVDDNGNRNCHIRA